MKLFLLLPMLAGAALLSGCHDDNYGHRGHRPGYHGDHGYHRDRGDYRRDSVVVEERPYRPTTHRVYVY